MEHKHRTIDMDIALTESRTCMWYYYKWGFTKNTL